jgi:hypothetical protein
MSIVSGYRVAAFLTPRDLVVESTAIDLIESGYDERWVSPRRKAYCNHELLAAI